MLLCFFIGNIVTIVSYHGLPARWITPFWQPAYPLHLYKYSQVNYKLCCCWEIGDVDHVNP